MKKTFLIVILWFMFFGYGKSNNCTTSSSINVLSICTPDTFVIADSVYWISFQSATENYLNLSNYINSLSGIDSIAIFYNNCNNLIFSEGYNASDSSFFKLLNVPSSVTCFIKLIRRQYQSTAQFSVAITNTRIWVDVAGCPLNDCQFIYNSDIETIPSGVTNNTFSPFVYNGICGWDRAWYSPQIKTGNGGGHCIYMWDKESSDGEGVYTRLGLDPNRQIVQGRDYKLLLDFAVENIGQKFYFVFANSAATCKPDYGPLPTPNQVLTGIIPSNLTEYPDWHNTTFSFQANDNWTYLTIYPVSDNDDQVTLRIDNINIVEDFTAEITANGLFCDYGDIVQLTASPIQAVPYAPALYEYDWSSSQTTSSINVNSEGTYIVAITTPAHCTATATYTIDPPMKPLASSENETCAGNDGSAAVTVDGGTPPYTYLWHNSIGQTISTNSNVSNLAAGDYFVTVTDAQGCTWTGGVTISQDILTNAEWTVIPGNIGGNEEVHDMVVNSNGDVYSIGIFEKSIDFGNGYSFTNPDPTYYQLFVSKHNKCGNIVSARVFSPYIKTADLNNNYQIELLSSGHIVIAGKYKANISFDGLNYLQYVGGNDIFMACLSQTNLSFGWQTSITGASDEFLMDMITAGNDIAIGGMFNSTQTTFTLSPPLALNNHQGNYEDLWIARYTNVNGTSVNRVFATNYPGNASFNPNDHGMAMEYMATIPNGSIFYSIKATVGGVVKSYLMLLNATTGALVNSVQIGTGSTYYYIKDMARYNGQLFLCGYSRPTYSSSTEQRAVLVNFPDPYMSGNHTIVANSGLNNKGPENIFNKILVTPDNNGNQKVYTIGTFGSNAFTFPGIAVPITKYGGSTNHMLMRASLTLSGESLSGLLTSTTGLSKGNALAVDINSNPKVFYAGGTFDYRMYLYFNSNPVYYDAQIGGRDAFFARFVDNGNFMYRNEFIEDLSQTTNSICYPNPSSGFVNINSDENILEINLFDIAGKALNQFYNTSQIDLSEYPEGVYMIIVKTETSSFNSKISIIK